MVIELNKYAALALVVGLGVLVSVYLFELYRAKQPGAKAGLARRWAEVWDFAPGDLGGFSYRQLALVSVLGLFLELLMIRWISSEIRIFAYFKNFVLIACFLSFGLGCYLCRRRINLLPIVLPLLVLALYIKLPWPALREVFSNLPSYLGATSEVQVWGVPSLPLNWSSALRLVAAVAVIVPLFALITTVFIPIGQMVGWYLENAGKGIFAYSANVLASLVGILLYTLLCFLYQPPAVWFVLAGVMLIWLLWEIPRLRWTAAAVFAMCIALVSFPPRKPSAVHWSPYQKLTLTPLREASRIISYELNTNESWYQRILDLSPEFVSSHPDLFREVAIEWNGYNLPYRFCPQPASVLVLGAGMGNDVAAALRNGARSVVAVEIDPLILELGRRLHFEKPYDSPRVRQIVDDARSYVQNSNDRFDLIVFSLLDSHTTSSHFSNIRIDNYVYTLEALRATKRLLRPDGVFIVKFQVNTRWIASRLYGLLQAVFGQQPLEIQAEGTAYTTPGRFFIAGSKERIEKALSDQGFLHYVKTHGSLKTDSATLTTDDWPYFYQHEPGLPASVIVISGVLIFLCWFSMRRIGTATRSVRWHFFFLGAGFLLLEAQIISKMALLFGTTWVVNSIVIAFLLLLIIAANVLVGMRPGIPARLAYAGLFISILASYSIPLERYFFQSRWLKVLVPTTVLCLPVFFAGIVFIHSFARANFTGEALGANLLGALVGGLLESLSLWTGLKSLLVIAGLLYLASYFGLRSEQPLAGKQADSSLRPAPYGTGLRSE